MMRLSGFFTIALFVLMAALPAVNAEAQTPVINSISPQPVSGGTGTPVTISGSNFGAPGDTVYFPGNFKILPTAWGSGWVSVEVPATWSGTVAVYASASGLTSAPFAFELTYAWWGVKWNGSYTWYMNQNGAPGCTQAETANRLQKATWSWGCGSGLSTTYGGTTVASSLDHGDGVSVHGWSTTGFSPNLIASAITLYNPTTKEMIAADVTYNSQHFTWSCSGAAGDMDVENIGTHEFGHCIGFGDLYGAADNQKTMFGNSSNGDVHLRSLHVRDVEGAEFVYPRAGRPNLTAGTPSGWWGPVVPRNFADATSSSAPLPTVLAGNAPGYINVAQTNNGLDCASSNGRTHIFLDDVWIKDQGWAGTWGIGHTAGWINQAVTVRGGRHTFKGIYDAVDEIVESNEGDNTYEAQFAWSPYGLADQLPVTRSVPPRPGLLANPNCEGFQFTGNWWGAVAICPENAADDYDLILFDDYSGSTQGYQTPLALSALGAGSTDFVLVNGNVTGQGSTRWAGVTRYSSTTNSDVVVHQSNQVGASMLLSTTYGTFDTTGEVLVDIEQLLKIHEVYLADTSLTYGFYMNRLSGSAELDMGLYEIPTGHGSLSLAVALSQQVGPSETMTYKPSAAGYFGIAVWKRGSADVADSARYEIQMGPALSNLNAGIAPPGFNFPAVPRNTADGAPFYAPLPLVLNGPDATCYLNWSVEQEGPNPIPPFITHVYFDNVFNVTQIWPAVTEHAPGPWWGFNSPVIARGGRHTITVVGDAADAVLEANEGDNTYEGQFVWPPNVLVKGSPMIRTLPPHQGFLAIPNSDGFAFTRTLSQAWVVALAPRNPSDDYDLLVYDDYTASTVGFSNPVGASSWSQGSVDFVVGHYDNTPVTAYPAAIRYSATAGDSCIVEATDAGGRNASPTGSFLNQVLGQDRLIDLYEAGVVQDETYVFRLFRTSGTADLSLAVHPSGSGDIMGRGVSAEEAVAIGPDQDILFLTATSSDWYPIVVYRSTSEDLAPATYDLIWGPASSTGLEDSKPEPDRFRFAGAYPNPLVERSRLAFELPDEAAVTLDVFDVLGRQVARLVDASLPSGRHETSWDGRDDTGSRVTAGKYYLRLQAGNDVKSASLLVTR